MYLMQKKSKITDWWIAEYNNKMAFVNIFSERPITNELLVVGYLDKGTRELGRSTNHVVKITKKGVVTAKGTFYPIKEAHPLYLQFLIEANKENTLIAMNWDYVKNSSNRIIIADVLIDGYIKEGVLFDFSPSPNYDFMLLGYSNEWESNIVLTTFNKRNVCIPLSIPLSVKNDIYYSSFADNIEIIQSVKMVQDLFLEKNK